MSHRPNANTNYFDGDGNDDIEMYDTYRTGFDGGGQRERAFRLEGLSRESQ